MCFGSVVGGAIGGEKLSGKGMVVLSSGVRVKKSMLYR